MVYKSDVARAEDEFKQPFLPLDLLCAIGNEIEESSMFCDRCGYVDCVCGMDKDDVAITNKGVVCGNLR